MERFGTPCNRMQPGVAWVRSRGEFEQGTPDEGYESLRACNSFECAKFLGVCRVTRLATRLRSPKSSEPANQGQQARLYIPGQQVKVLDVFLDGK
jgi:hypothetical protein